MAKTVALDSSVCTKPASAPTFRVNNFTKTEHPAGAKRMNGTTPQQSDRNFLAQVQRAHAHPSGNSRPPEN
jgi:hypothetical protein